MKHTTRKGVPTIVLNRITMPPFKETVVVMGYTGVRYAKEIRQYESERKS